MKTTKTLRERLEEKYQVTPACWEWIAGVDGKGYGVIKVNGKGARAHRVAYELYIGPIPEGLELMHQCDNPRCVNPGHLRPGTHAQNMAEMAARKRRKSTAGEKCSAAKLTNEQVRSIFVDPRPQKEIAGDYGVTQVCIAQIKVRRSWKTITADLAVRGGTPRSKSLIEHDGEKLGLSKWAKRAGIPASTIFARLKRGWPIEKALSTKPHQEVA